MLLVLCSLAPITGVNLLVLQALRRLPCLWAWRREAALAVLATPALSLILGFGAALGLGADAPCATLACGSGGNVLRVMGLTAALALGALALGGIAAMGARLRRVSRRTARTTTPAVTALQVRADRLAERLRLPGYLRPAVRISPLDGPEALTRGTLRPVIVLSSWMLTRLDPGELDTVLAHELAHIARRDQLVACLALLLRAAFWFVPTSDIAWQALREERELACDDLAVRLTRQPLYLAGALAKVWRAALVPPVELLAQPLVGAHAVIERRITRLLNVEADQGTQCSGARALALTASTSVLMLAGMAALVLLALILMGCASGMRLPSLA